MSVLIDTSVWIDFFRNQEMANTLEQLIEENRVVTNELILAEMVPQLCVHSQSELISLLHEIECQPIKIDWDEIVQMQVACIQSGTNGVGLPDLIIAQNAIQGNLKLLTKDKHFWMIAEKTKLNLF
jgi:predicted nucleic acid-binding protein